MLGLLLEGIMEFKGVQLVKIIMEIQGEYLPHG